MFRRGEIATDRTQNPADVPMFDDDEHPRVTRAIAEATMSDEPKTEPDVSPTAATIQEETKARGWDLAELGERTGLGLGRAMDLFYGAAYTAEEAEALGRAFDTGTEFWLNLQAGDLDEKLVAESDRQLNKPEAPHPDAARAARAIRDADLLASPGLSPYATDREVARAYVERDAETARLIAEHCRLDERDAVLNQAGQVIRDSAGYIPRASMTMADCQCLIDRIDALLAPPKEEPK
jgi:plasmid maintenance system antidote protein VapI